MSPACRSRRVLCRAALALPLLAGMPARAATPSPPWPGATLRGQGVQRFLGFKVYDVRLWTGQAFEPEDYVRHAFALELAYARSLGGAAIADRSIDEMRRIEAFDAERERRWRTLMLQAFPDVVDGDRLTGLHDGAGGVRFEYNARPTASLQDRDFARLFFGIWLSPRTSEPDLRRALIAA